MTTARVKIMGSVLLLLGAGCSSTGSAGGAGGSGTGSGTGGANATGGSDASGGSNGNGGSNASGGSNGSGGQNAAGGSPGSGGQPGAGGVSATGGSGNSTGAAGQGAGGGALGTGGAAPGTGGSAPAATTLVTSASGAYWMTGTLTTVTTGNANVTVHDDQPAQTWAGMGGAFNEMGWSVLQMLSQADRDKAMHLLYGSDGARFNMGRIPIGASDYAVMRYTEDETAGDTSLTGFSISRDMMYLIPYIKAAQALNSNIHFWASPWTPPTWMKTFSGSVNGATCAMGGAAAGKAGVTAFDGGCMNASTANLTAYAQYFVKFVQAYAAQGIPIDYVAPQNEPNYALGYPTCLWTAADYTKFVGQYLGPAMATTTTKLMLGTNSNNSSGMDTTIVTTVMGDATAKTFPKVVGLQWGMLDNYESNSSMYKGYGIPVWATEHMCGNYPWNPSGSPSYVEPAPNNQAYGVESWGYIAKAIRAGVTAYNAWNMVLDTMGKGNDMTRQWAQDALLTVNTSTKTLNITPAYYAFRHVSQFAQPGAQVLATTGGDSLGFKNPDGTLVGVMFNSGSATTYTVAIGGKKLQFPMPANGWATVLYNPTSN